MMTVLHTRTGVRAWIARQFDLLNVSWKLRWAESDRELLARQCATLPERLIRMDLDLAELRVRQAILRSSR